MKKFFSVAWLLIPLSVYAKNTDLNQSMQQVIANYLTQYSKVEHITGISMSVSLPKENKIRNYFVGKISNERKGEPVNPYTLFQIGNITKSFTAAIILQLEAEKKLDINQKLEKWLPQYPAWKDVTIKQLLNMTSGIPDYFDYKKFQQDTEKDRQWTAQELVDLIYPQLNKQKGYLYSNTNYLLAQMIIEKATQHSFAYEMNKRLISKNLSNTFYEDVFYPPTVMKRMMHGYYWDKSAMPALRGRDVTFMNLSFAQGAGGAVASTEDMIHWVRKLFSTQLYPKKQLLELTRVVSTKSGKPLKKNTSKDPQGFGLGVSSMVDPKIGKIWLYKGETLGYRAFYAWISCNNIVISIMLNSAVTSKDKEDHIHELFTEVYNKILQHYPAYPCKKAD